MKYTFIILILLLLFVACNSNDRFGDVHLTDDNGNPIGGGSDPNEWLLTELSCDSPKENIIYPAYPNPALNIVNLSFSTESQGTLALRLIDSNLDLIEELFSIPIDSGFSSAAINISNIESGTISRLEYSLTQGECTYSGYGDIKKQ